MFDQLHKGILALFRGAPAKPAAKQGSKGKPADPRGQAVEAIRANQAKVMTPERAELIRQAMAVHKAKQQILADLSDTDRQRLVALALRRLLNEGREAPPAVPDPKAKAKPDARTSPEPKPKGKTKPKRGA